MFEAERLADWVTRLRAMVPDAVAVLLAGSHARDAAGPHSDVDLRVLRPDGDKQYMSLFDHSPDGRLAHLTVEISTPDEWQAEADDVADWAFGLPAEHVHRLVWATPAVSDQIASSLVFYHPAGYPELEDFIDEVGKIKNARLNGDSLALRWFAQELARLAPGLLYRLNLPAADAPPPVRAQSATQALHLALGLAVAPPGYRDDMLVCLGLVERGQSDDEIVDAALRLALGALRLLRERGPATIPEQELRAALLSGVLEVYVGQGVK